MRELQREVGTILDRVQKGESVEITRRGRPVARLVPATSAASEPWPDLTARAEAVMGSRRVAPPPSAQLVDDRGEHWELQRHLPVPWTPLHELEVRNALRLLLGRGHIDTKEIRGFLGHIEDLQKGRFERPPVEMEAIFHRADALSQRHASTTLANARHPPRRRAHRIRV